jgi:hypothetical protein
MWVPQARRKEALDMQHSLATPDTLSLEKLDGDLCRLPTGSSVDVIDNNLQFIRMLGQPANILSMLTGALNDGVMLATIASRSYRHVNHFDKIVLLDSDRQRGYRLTLHLWDPPYTEAELNDELIHDHRFSFWSSVLTGTLSSENFSLSERGTTFRKYQYIPEKRHLTTAANFYEFVGEAKLAKSEPSRKAAGESYYLSYERIHRVLLPCAYTTCTLVLRGPRERNHSNVYNTSYPSTDTRLTNMMFSGAQVAEKISKLLKTIEHTRL